MSRTINLNSKFKLLEKSNTYGKDDIVDIIEIDLDNSNRVKICQKYHLYLPIERFFEWVNISILEEISSPITHKNIQLGDKVKIPSRKTAGNDLANRMGFSNYIKLYEFDHFYVGPFTKHLDHIYLLDNKKRLIEDFMFNLEDLDLYGEYI